jgi:anti-sigma regulatory factor (Ser/Thr protein kinase)
LRTDPDDVVGWLVERLAVVVSELCSNAVEAAPGRWFRVDIVIDPNPAANVGLVRDDEAVGRRPLTVRCSVTNPAADVGLGTLPFGTPRDPAARRGRGLLIVDGLSDRCRAERISDTMVVTAELSL